MKRYVIRGIPTSTLIFGNSSKDPIVYVKEFSLEAPSFSVEVEDAETWSRSNKDIAENIALALSKTISTYVFYVIDKD